MIALFLTSAFLVTPAFIYLETYLHISVQLSLFILIFAFCEKLYEDAQRYLIYKGNLISYTILLLVRYWTPVLVVAVQILVFGIDDFQSLMFALIGPAVVFFIGFGLSAASSNNDGKSRLRQLQFVAKTKRGWVIIWRLIMMSIPFHIWTIIFVQLRILDRLYMQSADDIAEILLNYYFGMVVTLLYSTLYFTAIRRSIAANKISYLKATLGKESSLLLIGIGCFSMFCVYVADWQKFVPVGFLDINLALLYIVLAMVWSLNTTANEFSYWYAKRKVVIILDVTIIAILIAAFQRFDEPTDYVQLLIIGFIIRFLGLAGVNHTRIFLQNERF